VTKRLLLKSFTYFDDPPASPPPAVPPTVPPPPTPPPGQTFTQEQVNKMMADHKRALQKQNEELVTQLQQLRDNANLTAQQKEELETRIQTLSQQHLTEAQKLQAELETTKKKYKTDTEALTNDSRKWKGSFEKLLVTNAITEGAITHKAANAKQLAAMLLPQAKVVEEVDDAGQPTGNFVAKLPVTVLDQKTKKPVTVELPIVEAIGKLREDPENANLFLVDGKPGFGGLNQNAGSGSGTPDISKMTPAQYREWRSKQSDLKRG